LVRGGRNTVAFYAPSGHLVYADADALFAVPLDAGNAPIAPATPVMHGIDHGWHSNVALSENGTVVYVPAERVQQGQLRWLDRAGHSTAVPGGQGAFSAVSLAPNGHEAAGSVYEGTKVRVWIYDLVRGTKRLFTVDGRDAIWNRDGTFITYRSDRENGRAICHKRADGTGAEHCLVERRDFPVPEDWSPDGRSLLFSEYTNRGDLDIWIHADGKTTPLVATPASEANATFSRDGRYIAFQADDGGVSQVYIQPFPGPGPRTTISTDEGVAPTWAADGRHLYYSSGRQVLVVPVQTSPILRVGEARVVVVEAPPPSHVVGITPDEDRFLTFSPRLMEGPPQLRVVLNWFDELERLAPHP
jgi:eukaryotic-like serine/threonine-protein kinase